LVSLEAVLGSRPDGIEDPKPFAALLLAARTAGAGLLEAVLDLAPGAVFFRLSSPIPASSVSSRVTP
jgi:hypothetical protein